MSQQIIRTMMVAACLASASLCGAQPAFARSAATTASKPRLYSTVAERDGEFVDVFRVRPRTVSVSCAEGGQLVLSWRTWTSRRATGAGHTRPCRGGSERIKVKAFRPIQGYFTRLTVRYVEAGGTSRLGLAKMLGMTWLQVPFYDGSGATPWPR